MAVTDEQFVEAENHWDLDTLYTDLASAKGKRLTPMEKLHLRGLLCGFSPCEIAEKLGKNSRGVETDLCATLYKYVKSLVGRESEKIDNWRNVTEWLEEAGYKSLSRPQIAESTNASENGGVHITNIICENNEIKIDVFLQIKMPLPSDLTIQNFNLNRKNEN